MVNTIVALFVVGILVMMMGIAYLGQLPKGSLDERKGLVAFCVGVLLMILPGCIALCITLIGNMSFYMISYNNSPGFWF